MAGHFFNRYLPWVVLMAVAVVCIPLFLCMPLWCDSILYDVIAKELLRGAVHYRDTFDNNFPGMIWLHVAIRSLLGWRSEVLRGVDLLVMALGSGFLTRLAFPGHGERTKRGWTMVALAVFYFSTPESCHVQRDMWILPLVALACCLRVRAGQHPRTRSTPHVVRQAFLEGLLWSLAIWIKPFVLIMGACIYLVYLGLAIRRSSTGQKLLADATGLLAGGLVGGVLGCLGLIWSGSWSPFWDVMLNWNPTYLSHFDLRARLFMTLAWLVRAFPFSLAHLLAVPLAILALRRVFREGSDPGPAIGRSLLAGLYLVAALLALTLQHPHDYVLAALTLIALTIVCACLGDIAWSATARCGVALFCAGVICVHPMIASGRLALWPRCLLAGSNAAIKDALALNDSVGGTNWRDLDKVAEFLRRVPRDHGMGVQDRELTNYCVSSMDIYLQLDVRPSTRFIDYCRKLELYAQKRSLLRRTLAESKQRFVLSDQRMLDSLSRQLNASQTTHRTDALEQVFPWNQPVAFRAGRYLVHRVSDTPVRVWPE